MLKTRDLTFSYDAQRHFSFPDLSSKKGESLLILGESGRGKTTLLNLLAGFLRPDSGEIEIEQQALKKLSDSELDIFRGRHIGMVFQSAHFVRALNVEENLRLAQKFSRNKQDLSIIGQTLQRLNLGNRLYDKPHRLSIGEQQRVAIARAVINSPKLILADEPTSALDDKNCFQVLDLLEEQAAIAGASLILVTHDKRLKDRFPHQIEL